nr:zinc-binding dehydrogenase [Corynebacterium glutamicum]
MHASGAQLKKITTLIDDNLIRPVVGETLPFTQIPAALKSLDNSTVRGKTVFSSNL